MITFMCTAFRSDFARSTQTVQPPLVLLISLRFERAWSVSVRVIKLLLQDSEHASRLHTRITLTHVRSEVKSTVVIHLLFVTSKYPTNTSMNTFYPPQHNQLPDS